MRKLYYAIYQKKFRNGRCDKILKVVVFDLGGTLMQYVGMPHSWEDFYFKGFEEIIRKFRYPISQEIVEKSFQMLKEFNPRINYREVEYSAEYILQNIRTMAYGYSCSKLYRNFLEWITIKCGNISRDN